MNPVFLAGGILAPALVTAAKSIPAAHLAKMGLLRGPLVGLGPVCGAFVGGAATVALLVPGSRQWLKESAVRALQVAKEWSASEPEDGEANGAERTSRRRNRGRAAAAEAAAE